MWTCVLPHRRHAHCVGQGAFTLKEEERRKKFEHYKKTTSDNSAPQHWDQLVVLLSNLTVVGQEEAELCWDKDRDKQITSHQRHFTRTKRLMSCCRPLMSRCTAVIGLLLFTGYRNTQDGSRLPGTWQQLPQVQMFYNHYSI